MKGCKRKREVQNKSRKELKKRTSSKNCGDDVVLPETSQTADNSIVETNNELRISALSDDDSDEFEESLGTNIESLAEEGIVESDSEHFSDESVDEETPDKLVEEDDDEELEISDPFISHFKYSLHPALLRLLESSAPSVPQVKECWPILRNVTIAIPDYAETKICSDKKLLEDDIKFTEAGILPKIPNLKEMSPRDLYIKCQIAKNLRRANCALNESADESKFLTEFQNELFCVMNNYQDLYFTKQTLNNIDSLRLVYSLHMTNHILKTRTKVLRHNIKIKNKGDDDVPDEFRDQGFVRPKVLVLLPFKSSAFQVISHLEKLLFPEGKKGSVMNKKRFLEEYGGNAQSVPFRKPEEYKKIFSGNTQDDFTMGISITRKALKLFSEFYSSDIIVASPLSLRRIIGAKGDKERDYDYLSSIELLILDQTDIFMMQNWHHVLHIFDHLHLKLKEYRRTDFSRVRLWSIDGHSKFYRQTLIFSSVNLPLIASLFNSKCYNYAGKVIVNKHFPSGAIVNVLGERQHNFYKFTVERSTDLPEKRFECFLNEIFPLFQDCQSMRQILLYIPSYYDFVRLRNHFMKQSINFVQICESSPWNKVAEARDMFCNQDVRFLLYTERYHFYNRITLKGIRHIVFYDLPNYPHYYSEICNMMHNGNLLKSKRCGSNFTVSALYSKADYLKLAPIVGTKKAQNMIASDRNVHQIILQDN